MAAAAARAYVPPPDDDPSPGGTMAFLEHLDELRKRIIRSLIANAVAAAVSFLFINRIFTFLMEPTRRVLPAGSTLIYTDPSAVFALEMQLTVIVGTVLASPYVMFQLWRFIAPALYAKEKRFAIPFVVLSSVGLVAGGAFYHYPLFLSPVAFFARFTHPELQFLSSVEFGFSLSTSMFIP